MTPPEVISILALVVSVASLGTSVYFGMRDRAHLVASSKFLPAWDESAAKIQITVVNAGRRSVILRLFVGSESKDHWVGTFLRHEEQGLRLGENERYERTVEKDDLIESTPDGHVEVTDFWFEDTLGRRYRVKDAKKNIKKLWAT